MIIGLGGATWLWKREAVLIKATVIAGSIFAVGTAAHVAWRYSYHGAILPNTAYAKVGLSMLSAHRGFNYVLDFLLTYPSTAIVAIIGVLILLRGVRERVLHPLGMYAGTCGYVILVGGDFMCMSRFLVPSVPFITLLFAEIIGRIGSMQGAVRIAAPVLGLVCVATNILPAFNWHAVPLTIRTRFHYNGTVMKYMNPRDHWRFMADNTEEWSHLGKALKLHSKPGESLVAGAIGAVGYYSELFIYDELGLVSREVAARKVKPDVEARLPAGHAKFVPPRFFLKHNPTYLSASLIKLPSTDARQIPLAEPPPGSGYEPVIVPLSSDAGFPEQTGLLLIRRRGDSS
jgi:hypothetical protein